MRNHLRIHLAIVALSLVACLPGLARAQQSAMTPHASNVAEMKFATVKGVPECASISPQTGDPTKGASIFLVKVSAGCTLPWHWHSANEHLILARGKATLENRGAGATTLEEGGFAALPARHVHQLHAETDCLVYVSSDAAFDIHYVNEKGDEIPLEAAMASGLKSGTK